MTDLERIKFLVDTLKRIQKLKQKEVGKLMGYTSESAFSQVLNGKAPVPHDFEKRLLELDSRLEEFLPKSLPKENYYKMEAVPLHLADPRGLEATGDKFYDLPDGTTVMQISVVPQKAWGSYQRGYGDPEFYDEFETIPVPVKKQHRGNYLAFEMKGKSMVNIETEEMARKSLWPGQKIIGRNLKREQWQYKLHIHSNEAWVIVHKVEGIMVKEIISHDIDTGLLTLHSWNPDKSEFPDRIIHIDDVSQLFNVVDPFGKMRPY